jgi:hypothetical protein
MPLIDNILFLLSRSDRFAFGAMRVAIAIVFL